MTPRQLKYFVEIARQLSFTRASAILHVTQPALSRQMQELESDLGSKLFVRSDLGVTLTAAGQRLAERAPGLLESFRQVALEVAALSEVPAGHLRVGIVPSLCDLVTTPVAREFMARYPDVRLSITEASSAGLVELISTGVLDFAIVASNESTTSFGCQPLLREPMVLASRPGAIDAPAVVAPAFLATLRMAASQQPNSLRRHLEDALAEAGAKPNVVLEANSIRLLTRMAADGSACCLLPFSAVAQMQGARELEVRAVEGIHVSWVLLHLRNVKPTPSVQALLDIVIERTTRARDDGSWPGLDVLARVAATARSAHQGRRSVATPK